MNDLNALSIDVEDWFHILDSPTVPTIEQWGSLESRIECNMEKLLAMLDSSSVKATFFWLGWTAEQHKNLVRKCSEAGHEVASHGYGHVLPYEVGKEGFKDDAKRAKKILEDITHKEVLGFRAAGFGIKDDTEWAFDTIVEVGYKYDSSIFPASRGHGGMPSSTLGPHVVETQSGPLIEIPVSAIEVLGYRLSLFGGGYLRLFPKWVIQWGIRKLHNVGHPLIVYVHPREIDPDQPRLPLSLMRRFKCYVNLESTLPKLRWLCENYRFVPICQLVDTYSGS